MRLSKIGRTDAMEKVANKQSSRSDDSARRRWSENEHLQHCDDYKSICMGPKNQAFLRIWNNFMHEILCNDLQPWPCCQLMPSKKAYAKWLRHRRHQSPTHPRCA